jgi:acetyl esterase/lipase
MPSEAFETVVQMMAQNDALTLSIPERRAAFEEGAKLIPPPEDVSFEDVDASGVPGEWVTAPGASSDRTLLYLHGGAYTICSPRTHRRLTAALSRETGARVLALDYRLAPEHPFPAAIEDAVTAHRWLVDGGTPPERLAIAGDSAGGGLAMATLVALRDRGLPLPAAAVAISPWADLGFTGESMITKADVDPMLSRERLKESADAYLNGTDARTPLASPIYADLTGLPPLLIHVGGREVLLDDAVRLADAAAAGDVKVSLEVETEMIHVWHVFAGLFPEADDGVRRVAEFLKEKL